MNKKYLAKIIARDSEGLQMISACCAEAKLNIKDIKYLPKNKIFLFSLERLKKEDENQNKKVKSICKFESVESVKSKNINQKDSDLSIELIGIDLFKNKEKFDINLIFSKNTYITLTAEIIEVILEDQNE